MSLMESLPIVGAGALLLVASRFLQPRGMAASPTQAPRRGRAWRWLRRLMLVGGVVLLVVGLGYLTLFNYLTWRETVSPSTEETLVLRDGRRIPLVQPAVAIPAAEVASATDDGAMSGTVENANVASIPSVLPPSRIKIARINADWPVMLSDVDYQLRTPAVGWIIGTAFPGAPGNIVLYGQLDGPYGTFMRLDEMRPGDEIVITTEQSEYRYRVQNVRETSDDDVGVMAPTQAATTTLITDVAGAPDRRLVVTATYIEP